MIAIIVILALLFVGLVFLILQWAKAKAASFILLYLAQSLLIKNLHPDRRPEYIVKKAVKSKRAILWVARPLVVWYIENRGVDIATALLRYLVIDLREDEKIELNK
jgi:hypothetical protein